MAITTNRTAEVGTGTHSDPTEYGFQVTKSDVNYLEDPRVSDRPFISRGISMDAAGALKVMFANGETATFPSGLLAAGVIHAIRACRIYSTGSGAQNVWVWE